MNRTTAALLVLLAAPAFAAPALAEDGLQGYKPLRDARTVPLEASPRDRLTGELGRLARALPATSKLVVPTNGRVRLAILLVELADCPRPGWKKEAWEDMLFSKGQYSRTVDGQAAFGSVHDYYDEQSGGKLDLQGKVFDWISIPARRQEIEARVGYSFTAKRQVLDAALDRLLAREGAHALDAFDGLGFVVSGGSAHRYGTVLWPHSGALFHAGRAWRYYLTHAGVQSFEPIGVHAHEIGHVLGLPDEYGLGQHAGSGIYCLMAIGNMGGWDDRVADQAPPLAPGPALRELARSQLHDLIEQIFRKGSPLPVAEEGRPGGSWGAPPLGTDADGSSELFCLHAEGLAALEARPLHLCAPCKAALGWVQPVGVRTGERVYLEAIEDHPGEVVALPLSGTAGKRLLLEYRGRRGFDQGLPRTGLLAWRTGDLLGSTERTLAVAANGELVPAHGIASVDAAHRDGVPWPWKDRSTIALEGARVSGIVEKDGRVYFEVDGP